MKKTAIFIFILFSTLVTTAQLKLNGTIGPIASVGYNRYTHVNWEISYKFEKRNNDIYLIYYNPKVTIPAHASYATPEKVYSKTDLGVSVWPQSNPPPSSLHVQINLLTPFGKTEPSGFGISSTSDNSPESWVCSAKINGKEVDLSAFKLVITKAAYNTQPVQELDNIINQRKGQNMTSASTAASNTSVSTPQNTSATAPPKNPSANNSAPAYNLSYSAVGIPENTPTYTKQVATAQVVNAAAGLVGELVNDWNANYDKKMARFQAESDAIVRRSANRQRARFEFYYNPLINLANSGDENAQVILYLESDNYLDDKVPLRKEWFKKAVENKNPIALLTKINESGYSSNEEVMHELADAGNVDAMVMLGLWYSQKHDKYTRFYKSHIYGSAVGYNRGAGNEELALKYLTMAAEKGSPNAMYHLAMVYKYGTTIPKNSYMSKVYKYGKSIPESSYMMKFNVEKNEKLAYEWLVRSMMPNYKESDYQTHHVRNLFWQGSYFESGSCFELAKIYEDGKIVPKDISKAMELKKLGAKTDEYLVKIRGHIE